MNFQTLPSVLRAAKYLDMAFREAGKQAGRRKRKSRQATEKLRCQTRMRSAEKALVGHLRAIVEKYPRIDALPDFYKELMALTLEVGELKKALASVSWAERKVRELTDVYMIRARKSDSGVWKAYYGRVSSIMRRIDKHLEIIERARVVMKSYPDIKEEYTVCLVGFPNVGKSTLLSKITRAKPEIREYAFTTKGLNIGYFEHHFQSIQVIDTPGTLDRIEKMNSIEKQAYLAIKHCADLIVFVHDSTFDHKKQALLKQKISKMGIPLLLYASKTDLQEPPLEEEYISSPDELKSRIGKEFDKATIKTRRICDMN